MKLLALLILCVGIAFFRSPSIPETPDSKFWPVVSPPSNAVSAQAFKELSDAFEKESAVFSSIQSETSSETGYKWLATKFTPEQSASVGRLAERITKSHIHLLPIKGQKESGDGSNFLYGKVAKALTYQFVIRIRAGDVAGARSAYSQFASLRRNLVSAHDINVIEFISILTVEGVFANLSNEIAASPWSIIFHADIRKALGSKSIAQTGLYGRALRTHASESSAASLEAIRNGGNPILSFFYDEAFIAAYHRKFASFWLPTATAQEIREFHESLPSCPMGEAKIDEKETDESVMIRKAHLRLVCPLDPLRGKYFPRFLLAGSYVGFELEDNVAGLEKMRNEILTFLSAVKPVR